MLPKHLLNNGVLNNKKYLKNKTSKLFTSKNPNLVIIFNAVETDINFITELLKFNIPIILCGYNNKIIKQFLNNNKQIYLFGLNLTETQLSFYKFLTHNILLKKFNFMTNKTNYKYKKLLNFEDLAKNNQKIVFSTPRNLPDSRPPAGRSHRPAAH